MSSLYLYHSGFVTDAGNMSRNSDMSADADPNLAPGPVKGPGFDACGNESGVADSMTGTVDASAYDSYGKFCI